MRPRLISLVACGVLTVPALALAGATGGTFSATLTGKAERPAGAPKGKGTAKITIAGKKVCWKLTVTGTDKPLAAHIHKGKAGKIGPIVVPFGKTYKRTGCTTTTGAIAAAISRTPAVYYVNVHTKRYPAGAVRGQLRGQASGTGTYPPPPTDTGGGYEDPYP